jgi:hypothetical protein
LAIGIFCGLLLLVICAQFWMGTLILFDGPAGDDSLFKCLAMHPATMPTTAPAAAPTTLPATNP